jgi:hypothetical protein
MEHPGWYDAWRHEAFHQLQAKNQQLNDQYRLGTWSRYDFDLEPGTLTFSAEGKAKVVAEIQIAGTASAAAGNWLWAWGNSHWPTPLVAASLTARSFGEKHGICELMHDYVEVGGGGGGGGADEDVNALGWGLTAAAVRACGVLGAYRPPIEGGGGLFLMIRSISWAA